MTAVLRLACIDADAPPLFGLADGSGVPHDVVMTAIELLGTEVLPLVRAELAPTD